MINSQRGAIFESIEEAKASILSNACFYIDDRDNIRKNVDALVYSNGGICVVHKNSLFCLNPLYIGKDRLPHLSKWSCSGVVNTKDMSLCEAFLKYNQKHKGIHLVAELLVPSE